MDQFHEHASGMPKIMLQPLSPGTAGHEGRFMATVATERRMQQTERSSSPHREAGTSDKNRSQKIQQLKEQIQLLEKELAYHVKLDAVFRNFVEEVSPLSERIRAAVLEFRIKQKATDHEFMLSRQL